MFKLIDLYDKRKKETIIKAVPSSGFSMAIVIFSLKLRTREAKQTRNAF